MRNGGGVDVRSWWRRLLTVILGVDDDLKIDYQDLGYHYIHKPVEGQKLTWRWVQGGWWDKGANVAIV